jgi:RNA polymerase sigma-70 factor, ECF subfamily
VSFLRRHLSPDIDPVDPIAPIAPIDPIAPMQVTDVAALYRAHAATVARWAALLGGPAIDVEDVVHEVFLVAQRRLGEFRGDGKVTTWLYRATDRVVRHERRRLALRRRLRLAPLDPDQERGAPNHDLARNEARRIIYRILETMSERYRTVFVLFEIEQLSGERIAELLSARVDTVWVWLHRARVQFTRRLLALEGKGGKDELPAPASHEIVRLVGRP